MCTIERETEKKKEEINWISFLLPFHISVWSRWLCNDFRMNYFPQWIRFVEPNKYKKNEIKLNIMHIVENPVPSSLMSSVHFTPISFHVWCISLVNIRGRWPDFVRFGIFWVFSQSNYPHFYVKLFCEGNWDAFVCH